jgi:predicted anti-sigma-YlaC factor YlaD
MPLCERVRAQLPQYVADGEPTLPAYSALREHLRMCASCRAFAARLRLVEGALHAYPRVSPAPEMAEAISRAVAQESQPAREGWRILPWDVWVPAVAFALAVVIAVMSIPAEVLSATSAPAWGAVVIQWPSWISAWFTALHLKLGESQFWAIWIGIFATTAGLGISLSLTNWTARHSQSLDRLEARVTHAAARLWDLARRSR